jgi:hypothetical protein
MSGYLQYSNYGDENENQKVSTTTTAPKLDQSGTNPTQQKRILRTNHRTLRSKPTEQGPEPHKYVQELIQKIHSYENGSSSDSDDDYAPLPNPSNPNKPNNSMQQQFQTEPVPNRNRFAGASGTDLNAKWNPAPAKEAFSLNTGSGYAAGSLAKANQPYVQSVFQASDDLTAAGASKDILLEKLDHITEELVLYCFLGVFIIFIVDSFARAGKYVR